MTVTAHPWLPDCLVLTGTGDLTQGRAWQTGMFYPQDPAARLAVLAAGLLPGNKVLDACAAPGGKSFAAAMTMGDQGELYACDLHAHKKALIEVGAARLGLGSITAQVLDARKPRKGWEGPLTRCWPMYPAPGWGSFAKSRRFAISPRKSWPDCPRCRGRFWTMWPIMSSRAGCCFTPPVPFVLRRMRRWSGLLASHGAFLWRDSGCLAHHGGTAGGGLYLWPPAWLGTDGFFLWKFRKEGRPRWPESMTPEERPPGSAGAGPADAAASSCFNGSAGGWFLPGNRQTFPAFRAKSTRRARSPVGGAKTGLKTGWNHKISLGGCGRNVHWDGFSCAPPLALCICISSR